MKKPDDMLIRDWNAFADFVAPLGVDATGGDVDDVTPWLNVWRAALMWEREGRIP